jgi:predicted RNA-binding Zn-ribbon protein involved in translation (DUF1610 family)
MSYCKQCGNKNEEVANFCTTCGKAIIKQDELQGIQLDLARTNSQLDRSLCPKCGKNDQVQRISALIDSGTSHSVGGIMSVPLFGRGNASVGAFVGQSRTQLSSRLISYSRPEVNTIKNFLISFGYA